MHSATRALARAATSGESLPAVQALASLRAGGVNPRGGQMVMIAGAPNAGKSMFMQFWLASMNLPTLYFSADMDPHTAGTRLAAMLTGHTVTSIAHALESGAGSGFYEDALSESRMQFCFDPNPSLPDIGQELDAYVELWDEYPGVIAIDNLLNVDGGEDFAGQTFVLQELHALARRTGAAVFVAHHASERDARDPYKPPARRDIQNKVTQYPELVLTVAANAATGEFRVATVKNRNGPNDPGADHPYTLWSDLSRCAFSNTPPPPQWSYAEE